VHRARQRFLKFFHRHKGKGGSGAHTRRLSHSSESKEAAEAETKGNAVAVKVDEAVIIAETQASLAIIAASNARRMARAADDADDRRDKGEDPVIVQHEGKTVVVGTVYAKGVYKGNKTSRFGKPHGFGELEMSTEIYQGEWKNGEKEGFGVFKIKPNARRGREGYTYEGEWKDGEMSGYGRSVHANGDSYSGYMDEQFDGYGVYVHFNEGIVHKCEYKKNLRNGFGTCESANMSYSGMYKDDKFVRGRGTIRSPTGVYTGDLKGDTKLKHGNGTYTYTNGDVYEGQFKNNKRYGKGKLTLLDGTVQEGIWSGDKMTGDITYPPGGQSLYGDFMNGVPLAPMQEAILSGDDTDHDA
jgi:hypothetical protein